MPDTTDNRLSPEESFALMMSCSLTEAEQAVLDGWLDSLSPLLSANLTDGTEVESVVLKFSDSSTATYDFEKWSWE